MKHCPWITAVAYELVELEIVRWEQTGCTVTHLLNVSHVLMLSLFKYTIIELCKNKTIKK